MSIKNAYLNGVYEDLAARYAEQTEFLEAVHEVLETLVPVVEADPVSSSPSASSCSACPGWTIRARCR